jgi:ATP-dependent Clp protease ATP-binding subunit ClpX
MSDDKEITPESLEDQLKSMLKQANLSFVMPGQPPSPAPVTPDVEEETEVGDPLQPIREFDYRPREIRDYLDRFVIRQDEAKKVLSVAICDHYNHVRACVDMPETQEQEYAKHNVVLLGPSGVGKTYLMRCIAKLIGVPFVKADATKFSETGYVGHDVDDLVRDLVKAADGNVELAQYGIIYLDEVDKIAAQGGAGKDVSGRGVQTTLLKLMEETDVSLFSQTDIVGQMQAVMELQQGKSASQRTVNTRHILFIVSGAFDTLAEQVKRRVKSSQIGFGQAGEQELEDLDYLHEVQTRDFIDYGFEPEFIGRLPVRVVCDPLSADDLEQIMLSSEGSVLKQYRQDFNGYGIQLDVLPEAVKEVAERAHGEKTGARGLMTVLERVLRDFKFELPSAGVKNLRVDRDTILNPQDALGVVLDGSRELRAVLLEADLEKFVAQFEAKHGLVIAFDKAASKAVIATCLKKHLTVSGFCNNYFRDLEYGLTLIHSNTKQHKFRITKAFVAKPGQVLSEWVAKSFETDPQS